MDDNRQEANNALMDLDKGLRSLRCGDQCEAIVRFQENFSKYPFPTFISSSFNRLADAFRNGNNVKRLCILRVAQQSRKHLYKISNSDEFLKRFFGVTHSNDAIARAITLRMLGSVSNIISEKKNVHHCICKGLDSHDRVEQESAIFATIKFASDSHDFAHTICNKIATLLKGLSTQLEIKLKLIPVLQYMHSDIKISTKARNILLELLPSYPAQDFVIVILKTLSLLSARTLVDVPSQVDLLLDYVKCDPRSAVKLAALDNLNLLASKAAHLWSNNEMNIACQVFQESDDVLKTKLLRVMCTLSESTSLISIDLSPGSALLELCGKYMYENELTQCALAIKLQASLLSHALRRSSPPRHHYELLRDETIEAVDGILLLLIPAALRSPLERRALQIVLSVLHLLCDDSGEAEARIYDIFFTFVYEQDRTPLCSDLSLHLLEALAAIATRSHFSHLLHRHKAKIRNMFVEVCGKKHCEDKNQSKTSIFLFVLLCICDMGSCDATSIFRSGSRAAAAIDNSSLGHWTLYRISRQAMRLGQHGVARRLLKLISDRVASEQHHFWMSGLEQLAAAESVVSECFRWSRDQVTSQRSREEAVSDAVRHYHTGISILMAAFTPTRGLSFHCEYARLRCETLHLHSHLIVCCQIIRVNPPPALLGKIGSSGDDKMSDGANKKLKECIGKFLKIDNAYNDLRLSSFDCDPSTLANIQVLQQSCAIMAFAIEALVKNRSDKNFFNEAKSSLLMGCNHEHGDVHSKSILAVFDKISKRIAEVLAKESTQFTELHTYCLAECSSLILSVPFSYPRFFFQNLQSTNIKLSVTPNHRSVTDPFRIDSEKRLALKVEGLVERSDATSTSSSSSSTSLLSSTIAPGSSSMRSSGIQAIANTRDSGSEKDCEDSRDVMMMRLRFREIAEIKLQLTVNQQTEKVKNQKVKTIEKDVDRKHERTIEPNNDYFGAEFLICFPQSGFYNVVIETSIKDQDGVWWRSGPRDVIYVKATDEAARIQQQLSQNQQRAIHHHHHHHHQHQQHHQQQNRY